MNVLSTLETQLELLRRGLWAVAIYPDQKNPIGEGWGIEQWTVEYAVRTHQKYPRAGVGICLGPDRAPDGEWLIDVEGDGPEADESRAILFGGEAIETIGWGSVRGPHQILRVDRDKMSTLMSRLSGCEGKGILGTGVYHFDQLPKLELRIGGYKPDGVIKQIQSVCPPTRGTDGEPREWNGVDSIADAPDTFYAILERIADEIEAKRQPSPVIANGVGHSAPAKPKLKITHDGPDAETRAVAYLAKCEPSVSGQHGHDKAFKAACKIGPGFDLSQDATLQLLRTHFNPKCDPPWSERELLHKVDEAFKVETRRGWLLNAERNGQHKKAVTAVTAEDESDWNGVPADRPEIEINTERHRVLAETLAVLSADQKLFARGDVLVRLDRFTIDDVKLTGGVKLRKAAGSYHISSLGEAGLSCRLTEHIDFYVWGKDKAGESTAKPAHPTDWLLKAILEHGVYPGVRPLVGVAEVPFPRPDGTLVTTPGYDHQTGVFYAPSVAIKPLPDGLTEKHAVNAATRLFNVVKQFPFAGDDDFAVWLAALLTVMGRAAIDGAVPGTAFNGNRPGLGKGKLIDTIGVISAGRPVPTTAYPTDKAEADKVKVAFALAATPIVHLDNLEEGESYGGGVLDSAITSTTVSGRILGSSKSTEGIELRCCWFLSGNNISPTKDAYRRWLVCNLLTDLERPEERNDLEIPDLLRHVHEHRAELVRAALVILLAHAIAGRPTGGWAPLGSFQEWDKVIRGAVWFATGRDCNATRRKAAEESPERQNKLALLEAWKELPGGGPDGYGVTSEEAHQLAFGDKNARPVTPPECPDLGKVLVRFSRDGKVSVRGIGCVIRAMRGQNFNGLAFGVAGEDKRSNRWRVVTVNPNYPKSRQ